MGECGRTRNANYVILTESVAFRGVSSGRCLWAHNPSSSGFQAKLRVLPTVDGVGEGKGDVMVALLCGPIVGDTAQRS